MSQNVIINLINNSVYLSVSDWINLGLDKICKIYVIRPNPFTMDGRATPSWLVHWPTLNALSFTMKPPIGQKFDMWQANSIHTWQSMQSVQIKTWQD